MSPRRLGQHFLKDGAVAARIVKAVGVGADEVVVEVGPGLGALTGLLARESSKLALVELDAGLASALRRRYASNGSVCVVEADARTVSVRELPGLEGAPYVVAGNLPYYAASPIIRNFIESSSPPQRMVVMVQREVARQICAPVGRMSMLSVAMQMYADAKSLFDVQPAAFRPPPKVVSTVVELRPLGRPRIDVESPDDLFRVVKAGFSQPRKQLRNSMAGGLALPVKSIDRLFELAEMDATRRPATLSLDDWGRVYRAYAGISLAGEAAAR